MSRPIEPSQIISSAGPSAVQDAAKERRKLTRPGRKLVQDYVDSLHAHGRKLTLEERKNLLRQVQALPGCASYTLQNLTTWLQNHQYANKPYRNKNESSRPDKWPTLTTPMRTQLTALLALETDSTLSPAKVEVWAGMLAPGGAARHEVFEYAELQFDYVRVKAMMAQRLPTPTSPTPTPTSPAGSVSPIVRSPVVSSKTPPAPVVAYAGAHGFYGAPPLRKSISSSRRKVVEIKYPHSLKHMQSSRPLARPVLPTRQSPQVLPAPRRASPSVPPLPSPAPDTDAEMEDMDISPEGSRASTPMPVRAPTQTQTPILKLPSPPPPPPPVRTLRASLLLGVADALRAPPPALPAGAMPASPEEFRALFAAYEAPLAQILCALEL